MAVLRILIAGCGDVGVALSRRLFSDGHRVWGLRRNPALLPDTVANIKADLTRRETLSELPPSLDAVVYSAAADDRSDGAYSDAYLKGVGNLILALQEQGHTTLRFLLTSSTSVYTQRDGGWVDEDSPAEPDSARLRTLRDGEARVLNSPWQAVVVRFGGIYGPGRNALIRRVLSGDATCARGLYGNRIHRDDCAGVLLHLLTLPEPRPVYLAVDCAPAPICEVMRWLADRLDVPPPRESAIAVTQDAPPARSNKRCSNRRLLESGYRFHYPSYREGYAAVLGAR